MWSSPIFWIVFAIAVFWALGANNRLMRLRSAVVQAFGSVDAHMVRQLAFLGEMDAAHAAQSPQLAGAGAPEMAALQGAVTQLSASLAMARARPLKPDAVAALAAAREVLHACWQKVEHSVPAPVGAVFPSGDDCAAAPAPAPRALDARWQELAQHNDEAVGVFNDAVLHYNSAIAQFPASFLAWVFGFKAARGL